MYNSTKSETPNKKNLTNTYTKLKNNLNNLYNLEHFLENVKLRN